MAVLSEKPQNHLGLFLRILKSIYGNISTKKSPPPALIITLTLLS